MEEVNQHWSGVDILVNNAGIGYRSVVEHVSESERLMQMDINFRSPMELTRLVLPGMRAKRKGRIINVSSVGGMMAMPTMAVYSASKFALEGASEALWYEIRSWGLYVTLVEPGFINSLSYQNVPFTELAQSSLTDRSDPYHAHYLHMKTFIERVMRYTMATSDTVAKAIIKTIQMRRPPLRMAGTADAWLFALTRRIFPQRIYSALL